MYLYEESIIKDINRLFTNSSVCAVIGDNINDGLKKVAAMREDKTTLPAIVLSGGNWQINDTNFYSLMHGSEIKRVNDNKESKNINIIPITPSYSMYIIAQSSRECDMLTRELVFHYSMNPTLTVNIPYGIDNIHTFNIIIGNSITKSVNMNNLVYRTLNFTLQGAYLWHNNTFNISKEVETTTKLECE